MAYNANATSKERSLMVRYRMLAAIFFIASVADLNAQFTPTSDFSERVLFAFRQGAQNNCAVTSVIKAAIATYGMEASHGVFLDDVTKDDGSHDITMRDGTRLTVTKEQIRQANDIAQYAASPSHQIDTAVFDRSIVLYAVMALRAVGLNARRDFSDAKDYASSLQRLSDPGRNADTQPQLLGLACKQVQLSDTNQPAYIHANFYHTALRRSQTTIRRVKN
jgi:hypothetical protein